MIYQLCNQGNEQNDTFYSISIVKKSSLPRFNHLTSDTTIETIFTSIADSSDVIITDLLPENLTLSATTRTSNHDKTYSINSSFVLTPLDKNIQTLLEEYNNEEVVVLLKQHNTTFIYGTYTSPLVLTYNEKHGNKAQDLKGYTVFIKGTCLGASKQFETIEFDIFSRGLAFELAGSL